MEREELACLLLGNLIYQPAPLPDKIAGLPSQLLLDMVANSTTLRASTRGRYSLWKELNSRAASSDSCEGTFASYHGSLGMKPDVITLLGRAITLDFEAHLRSLSEEERGFPLPEASKVYFARPAEDASDAGTGKPHSSSDNERIWASKSSVVARTRRALTSGFIPNDPW